MPYSDAAKMSRISRDELIPTAPTQTPYLVTAVRVRPSRPLGLLRGTLTRSRSTS
jgi:hypothetical protein